MSSDRHTHSNDPEMHRRRITISGDRYLYFYTFGDEPAPLEGAGDATEEPRPDPEEERDV